MLTSEKSILGTRIALIVMLGSLYSCGGGGGGSPESGGVASAGSGATSSAGSGGSSDTSSSGSGSVAASNNLPSFESSDNISVVEHQSEAATIEIDDADADDSLSLEISGGEDQEVFELGVCNTSRCTSNSLAFKSAPDFEAPSDADQDNNYEIVISAFDGKDTIDQELNISVTNYAFAAEAKGKMRSMEFNAPSVEPAENLCITGTDVPISQKLFCEEVYSLLHSTLGGYPNYIHVIWNADGTDANAKPVLDKLSEIRNQSLSVSNLSQNCLSGHEQGEARTSSTNFYSVCYQTMSWTADPFGGDDSDFVEAIELSLNYAHEYFHHYQRAHALERGFDYQSDRNNPSTTVLAPTWWIEGAAIAHQNIWFQTHFSQLSAFSSSTPDQIGAWHIAKAADSQSYKSVRRALMNVSGEEDGNCGTDWEMSELEETYETMSSCTGWRVAVPYLAHLTSWKTVWVDIPMNYYDLGFWGAVEKFTGLTKEEFYSGYNKFMRAGDAEDEIPEGWTPTESDWRSADFLNVTYEKL